MDKFDKLKQEIGESAEVLYKTYQSVIDLVVPIFNKSHTRPFSKFDAYVLGKILKNFENWKDNTKESLVYENLGKVLPDILNLIAMSYATSIMLSIASIQPIDEREGDIFYKRVIKSDNTFEWATKEDKILSTIFMLEGYWGLRNGETFDRIMAEEAASDLVSEINAEVSVYTIKKIVENCQASVSWSRTPPDGVSIFDHNLSFVDAIVEAYTKMHDTAGRGVVNYMIASSSSMPIIETQPLFKKIATGGDMGPHLYGFLQDSTTVIMVPDSLVDENTIYCGYRGMNWFEAAIVYSPFHYLFITDYVSISESIKRGTGLAHNAGIKVVNPDYLVKIILTD